MNLAINARDAMPEGGTIHISARNAAVAVRDDLDLPPGDYVVLTVADTGCGIAPDMLERVMEPFFTTKDIGKGTGLGLSMVHGFANQSGGTVRIDSCEGDGTSVELWLPRAAECAARTVPTEPAHATSGESRLNILLVDDHEGVRATTAALLEDLGHVPVAAADGPAVLDLLGRDPDKVDLIVSDYAMPHVSGAEVVRRARQIRPGLPAIIITGYADNSALDLTGQQVIAVNKPFTPEQMKDAIRRAMELAVAA
jgi:CheY-like chemotaxis protein